MAGRTVNCGSARGTSGARMNEPAKARPRGPLGCVSQAAGEAHERHKTPLDNAGATNLPSPPTRLYPSILIGVFDHRRAGRPMKAIAGLRAFGAPNGARASGSVALGRHASSP